MKKKVLCLATLLVVSCSVTSAIILAKANNYSDFTNVSSVTGATVVFDGSHRTAYTALGNPIASNANSSGTYLHVFTSTSSWSNTTPIQKITSFRFTYNIGDLGVLNKMHIELRSSLNSGVLYSSAEILTKLGGGTKSYSMDFNYNNAHYIAICVESYSSTIPVNIVQAVITYTCE